MDGRLIRAYRDAVEEPLQQLFDAGIREAVRPYEPGPVRLVVHNSTYSVRQAEVTVPGVGMTFNVKVYILGNPEDVVRYITTEVASMFKDHYTEPEEHILLGEN